MTSALQYEDNWETERYALLTSRVCDLNLNFEDTLSKSLYKKAL